MNHQKRDGKKPRVKCTELELAMSFVSSGAMYDAMAYVSRKTGKIYWESSGIGEEDELPDDLHDSSLYAAVPHQSNLDLGKRLVLRFTTQALLDNMASNNLPGLFLIPYVTQLQYS